MNSRPEVRQRSVTEYILLSFVVAALTAITVSIITTIHFAPQRESSRYDEIIRHLSTLRSSLSLDSPESQEAPNKRLIFYNRPPKTGSTTVRVAMKHALDEQGLISAKCFNMIEWNEMALRTILHRRNVDFYGCHTRLDPARYAEVSSMRQGNVAFMTSTRDASKIVLSAYLQGNRDRDFAAITDKAEIQKEVQKYKKAVREYPVDALYSFHGAQHPLQTCPHSWQHIDAMRRVAERYEIIIDLDRPQESAAMVEIVTGLKPNFTIRYNERTADMSSPCLSAMAAVNTDEVSCGNAMVHEVLTQQFNIIKDRLMQNRCFDEGTASWKYCDMVELTKESNVEHSREESIAEGKRLRAEGE